VPWCIRCGWRRAGTSSKTLCAHIGRHHNPRLG
jgi:hypothetical protein